MKTLLYMVGGAVAGFVFGILGPVLLYLIMAALDPAMRQGAGTPFAILIIFTAPAGAIAGASWGYKRVCPTPRLVKSGPWQELNAFDEHFAEFSDEEQYQAMQKVLPSWLEEYRNGMRPRFVIVAILTLASICIPFILIFVLGYIMRTGKIAFEMRSILKTIRDRWGDQIFQDVKPLPLTLRSSSPE